MLCDIVLQETYSISCIYLLLSPEISGRMYNTHKNHNHASRQSQTPRVCRARAKQHFIICMALLSCTYSVRPTWGSLLHRVSLFFFSMLALCWGLTFCSGVKAKILILNSILGKDWGSSWLRDLRFFGDKPPIWQAHLSLVKPNYFSVMQMSCLAKESFPSPSGMTVWRNKVYRRPSCHMFPVVWAILTGIL